MAAGDLEGSAKDLEEVMVARAFENHYGMFNVFGRAKDVVRHFMQYNVRQIKGLHLFCSALGRRSSDDSSESTML